MSTEGLCCDCGYFEDEETPCSKRTDGTHCEHWYDGPFDAAAEISYWREKFEKLETTRAICCDNMEQRVKQLEDALRAVLNYDSYIVRENAAIILNGRVDGQE